MAIRPPSPPGAVEIPVSLSTSVGKFTSLQYWNGSAFVTVAPGGGVSWGGISGTLSDQTDLNSALTSINNVVSAMSSTFTTSVLNVTGQVSALNLHGKFWKAADSGGAYIISNSNTTVATFGAGGGSNFTFDGGVKHNSLDADRILGLDSGKNLVALSTATYPSLTELSYLKGVTSSVQDQVTILTSAIASVQSALTSVDVALSSALVSVRRDLTYYYYSDFIELGGVALYGGVWGGTAFNSGNINGLAINSVDMSAHPGVRRIARASAGANSGYALTAFAGALLLSGSENCNLIMQFNNALTSIQGYYGFINTATNTYPTNGCFFNIKPGGEIQAVNNRNGVSASSGVMLSAAVSTWYLFNVSISPVNATCAYYRIMDMAGSVLASTNVTANIPVSAGFTTGNGLVVFYQASAAAVGLPLVDVDYMDLRLNKPAGRPL